MDAENLSRFSSQCAGTPPKPLDAGVLVRLIGSPLTSLCSCLNHHSSALYCHPRLPAASFKRLAFFSICDLGIAYEFDHHMLWKWLRVVLYTQVVLFAFTNRHGQQRR